MLIFVCFLATFGSSLVHGYNIGVLNSPQDVSQSLSHCGVRQGGLG